MTWTRRFLIGFIAGVVLAAAVVIFVEGLYVLITRLYLVLSGHGLEDCST